MRVSMARFASRALCWWRGRCWVGDPDAAVRRRHPVGGRHRGGRRPAAHQPPLLLAAVLGVAAVGRWWLYFDMVSLAGLVLILAALIVVETTRYAQIRRSLRGAESSAAVDAK
jgi:hypothetical protein